jgi:hypothetical protein
MFQKCVALNVNTEKLLLQASNCKISTFKLSKSSLDCQSSFMLDSAVVFLDIVPHSPSDFFFLLCENMDWAIFSADIKPQSQGHFSLQKVNNPVAGCIYPDPKPIILLSLKQNILTFIRLLSTTPPKTAISAFPLSDDIHWPSNTGTILSICPLRGTQTTDFAVL